MTEFRKFSAALDDAKLTLQTAAATDNSDSATARRAAAEAIRRRCADGDLRHHLRGGSDGPHRPRASAGTASPVAGGQRDGVGYASGRGCAWLNPRRGGTKVSLGAMVRAFSDRAGDVGFVRIAVA